MREKHRSKHAPGRADVEDCKPPRHPGKLPGEVSLSFEVIYFKTMRSYASLGKSNSKEFRSMPNFKLLVALLNSCNFFSKVPKGTGHLYPVHIQ